MSNYELKITVSAVSKNKEALEKAKQDVDGIGKASGSASAELRKMAGDWAGNILGAATFVEAGKAVINMLKASVTAFAEAELAQAKRDAQFEATDAQMRTSIGLLDSYAESISNITAVDDDMVIAQEEVLLQFRSISGDAIPKALRAAIDMAGGFRGNVIGSTESLGRSLEMVAQGGEQAQMALNLMRRQGIILDADTRKQILTLAQLGRTEEAQIVLLNAISDLMGGKASAAAQTLAGRWETTKNSAENLGEEIGSYLAPEIERQLKWVNQSISGWTNYLQVLNRAKEAAKANGEQWLFLTEAQKQAYLQSARHVPAIQRETDAHEDNAGAIDDEIFSTRELALAQKLLTVGMAGELDSAFKQYEIDLKAGMVAQEEAIAGMQALDRQGVSPTAEAYQQFTDQLNQANSQILTANQGLQKQIALMIFHNAAAHLDAKGQLQLAHAMGLISDQDYEVALAIEALTEKYDTNEDGIVDSTEAVEDYVKELDEMRRVLLNMPVEVNSTVTTTYVTVGTPPGGTNNNQGHESGSTPGGGGYAAGADFIVPPGYMNDSYQIGVQTGERVTVVPRDEVPQSYAESLGGPSMKGVPAGGIHIGTLIVQGGGISVEEMVYRLQMAAGEN